MAEDLVERAVKAMSGVHSGSADEARAIAKAVLHEVNPVPSIVGTRYGADRCGKSKEYQRGLADAYYVLLQEGWPNA